MSEREIPLREEEGMKPTIRVVPAKHHNKIHDMSRINYAKVYTVEHNGKTYDVGNVRADYINLMKKIFRDVFFGASEEYPDLPSMENLSIQPSSDAAASANPAQDQYYAMPLQGPSFTSMHYKAAQEYPGNIPEDKMLQYTRSLSPVTPTPMQNFERHLISPDVPYIEASTDLHRTYSAHIRATPAIDVVGASEDREAEPVQDVAADFTTPSRGHRDEKYRHEDPRTTMSRIWRKGKGKGKSKD